MKKPDRPYHHGQLAEAILTIATKIVTEKGVDALSLRACAREIDVDPSAVYRHYKSKDDILIEMTRQAFSSMADKMETALSATQETDEISRLVDVGLAYVRFGTEHPNLFVMMFQKAGHHSSSNIEGKSKKDRNPYEILTEAWAALADRNNIKPAEQTSALFALWSQVHGITNLIIHGLGQGGGVTRDQDIKKICRALIFGLLSSE